MTEERRVARSKKALLDAYVRLAKQGEAEKITVAALCEEADVHRSTFYGHYHDFPEFLLAAEQQITEEFLSISADYRFDTDYKKVNDRLFMYILEHADMIFTVLFREGGPGFSTISRLTMERTLPFWEKESSLPPEQLKLLYSYFIGGMFSFMQQWWSSGFLVETATAKELYENVGKYGIYNYIYTV